MVHLTALEAAATAQTGGGRDWREEGKAGGGSCSEEGSGRLGRGRRENHRERWEEAKRMQGSAETGWSVLRPLAVSGLAGDRFPRDSGGVSAGSGGGRERRWPEPPLNLAKWQRLRAP